jgi:hypothetical protein
MATKAKGKARKDPAAKSAEDPKSYDVGYKRPPVASRFKPGCSGNPAGRPPGQRNFGSIVRAYLNAEVVVTSAGRRQTMTRADALVHQVFSAAIKGDIKAFQHALALARSYDLDDAGDSARDPQLDAQALELIRQLVTGRKDAPNEPQGSC